MEHVGIVVDDLAAATEFFVELGLELQGEGPVEGRWVDRVVGLDGVRSEIAMLQTPDGHARLELSKFHTPSTQAGNRHAPANTPGIRHVAFVVEDIDAVVAGLRARGAELERCSGTQFDPEIVAAFRSTLAPPPTGEAQDRDARAVSEATIRTAPGP